MKMSRAIRDLLKMRSFNPDWMLASKMADIPMVWLIQVKGSMIVDARPADDLGGHQMPS